LDGEGARLYGGRWNSPGRPMIYASASPSLAVLEVLVHLDLPIELMPDDYRLLAIEIADDAQVERLAGAPDGFDACRNLGDAFLGAGAALALLVPSIIVPQETNALINVAHPDMTRVRLIGNEPFRIDPRLIGRP
jgi:RES domain-containing protein